jgi:catechol 2,3-dioxygenase-like lactoylglutathione lyase family enzyme
MCCLLGSDTELYLSSPLAVSIDCPARLSQVPAPDGNGRLELTKFHSPSNQGDNWHAPANTRGIRHVAFAVEDIDAVIAGLRAGGAELFGELERYQDSYRLCYVRGPEGIIFELEEQIG